MDDVRCPMCGKFNPPNEEVCQFCQARLKPIEGFTFSEGDLYFDSGNRISNERSQNEVPSSSSELPDWLRSFRQEDKAGTSFEEEIPKESIPSKTEDEDSQEEISSEAELLPPWLHSLGEQTLIEEAETSEEESEITPLESKEIEASMDENIPDWLVRMRHMEDVPASDEPFLPKNSFTGIEGQPEWLHKEEEITPLPDNAKSSDDRPEGSGEFYSQDEEAKETPELPLGTAEGLTDWLRKLGDVEGKIGEPEKSAPDNLDESDLPGWLTRSGDEFEEPEKISELEEGITPAEEERKPVPEPEPIIPPQEEEPVPDWLGGLEASTELIVEERAQDSIGEKISGLKEGESVTLETTSGEAEPLPDYFQGAVAPFTEEELDLLGEEMPDWMGNLPVSEIEVEKSEEKTEDTEIERGELPGWLEAIRPTEVVEEVTTSMVEEDARVESAGPLVGLRGVLPAEPEIARINKTSGYSVKLQIPEKQQARITALQELMAEEGKPKPVQDRLVISSQHILRVLIFIGLSLTVVWASFLGGENIILPAFPVEVFDASQAVNSIPSGAPVLLAVDYEPGFSAEMEAASTTVIDHLMLKGAYLTIVSTTPTGPALGERLVNLVNRRGNHYYQDANQYINLGYLPGGLTGLLAFAETPQRLTPLAITTDKNTGERIRPWQDTQLKNLGRLADFSLIIVLTESPDIARAWIEQIQPVLGQTPIVMVTSAQAEPLVRPYYEGKPQQIRGLVTGVAGGASYEKLTMRLGPAANNWSAYSDGILVAVLLILIAGAINAVSGFIRPTKLGVKAKP